MGVPSEKGKLELNVGGDIVAVSYEISGFLEGEFDLTVWYRGEPVRERVRWYCMNPHDDVEFHARRLLERHLKQP